MCVIMLFGMCVKWCYLLLCYNDVWKMNIGVKEGIEIWF